MSVAFGHWPFEIEVTCPLCDHSFTHKSITSGFCPPPRLDLKPADPATRHGHPICLKCTFVIFEENLDADTLKSCRVYLKSKDYKRIKKRSASHRLARIYETLGKDSFTIAKTYLEASWEEEENTKNCKQDREQCVIYLRHYVEKDDLAFAQDPNSQNPNPVRSRDWHTSQLLIGELLRLMQQFEQATEHFELLIQTKGFYFLKYDDLLLFELNLCVNRDSKTYSYDDIERLPINEKWSKLKGCGANLKIQDSEGNTALHFTAKKWKV
ncbi:MAG: DUF2225 domain-containing protein, partial [Bacteroidales bacterium]|nr:DUF2225 domain-containing protein [Bacteroidales bacterium]